MSQFPLKMSVTKVVHSWMDHLKDEWRPTWATVRTDGLSAAAICAAHEAAKNKGFAGAVPALTTDDFELKFTNCTDDPIQVSARFFTVTVTCQGMRIELFDPLMELKTVNHSERLPAYIRIECSLSELL